MWHCVEILTVSPLYDRAHEGHMSGGGGPKVGEANRLREEGMTGKRYEGEIPGEQMSNSKRQACPSKLFNEFFAADP